MPGSASVGGDPGAPRSPFACPGAAGHARVAHPAVDEFGDGYAVYTTASRTVGLSEALASFLTDTAGFGLKPVVMTRTDAALSAHVVSVLGRLGGYWAAQDSDAATFDALSGRRIQVIEDLWNQTDPFSGFQPAVPVTVVPGSHVRVLGFDLYVEHQARETTRISPLAQNAVEALGGGRLTWWGLREPSTDPWNETAITELVQSQMPKSQTILAGSDGGGFAQVRVSRTKTGLLEHASGGVPAPADASTANLLDVASAALERVAQDFRVAVGVVSLAEYDAAPTLATVPGTVAVVGGARDDASVSVQQLVRGVQGYAPEVPLAVIFGTRMVREAGLDAIDLSGRFDVRPVGPGRLKAQLVRLSGEGAPWVEFADFARHALAGTSSRGVA